MKSVSTLTNKWIWLAGGLILLLFYFVFDPLNYAWMPQCVFHRLTGLQCMGCGSQRVIHALLHGDIEGAFHANALLVAGLPFIFFLIYLEFARSFHPKLYAKIHSLPMIIIVTATLVAWLFTRNLLGI